MFNNVGEKIKTLAKVTFYIESVSFIISGIVMLFNGDLFILYGLLTIVLGPIVSLVQAWFVYGFGELITETKNISLNTESKTEKEYIPLYHEASPKNKKSEKSEEVTVKDNRDAPPVIPSEHSGYIICPKCNTMQRSNRKKCFNCAQPFEAQ